MESRHLRETSRDEEYVKAYLETKSQIKAAEICGVSRETVARAVRRANIPLTGRKYNDGKSNGMTKISDEQLANEVKEHTCREIAIKYGMSEERVYRRAKKLNLPIEYDRSGGKYFSRVMRYGCRLYDETISLKGLIERDRGICQICGEPVELQDIHNGHIGRMYPTLDHIVPISKGGEHIWENVQLTHMCCNAGKGDKTPSGGHNTV